MDFIDRLFDFSSIEIIMMISLIVMLLINYYIILLINEKIEYSN
jgi:hypothetical protein